MKKIILFLFVLLFVMIGHSQVTYTWVTANDSARVKGPVNFEDSLSGDGSLWFTDPHNATNVAIGDGAMASDPTHGSDNVGIGRLALEDVGAGAINNVAVGTQSQTNTSTGDNNSSLGYRSMFTNTTGLFNVSIGGESLRFATDPDFNTVVGYQAMYSNTTYDGNTSIGYQNLYLSKSGQNTSVGYKGFYNSILTTTVGKNTGIGYEHGYNNISGTGNVLVGYQAGYNWNGSNALFIDNSNTTTPLIFGDFSQDSVTIHGSFSSDNSFAEMHDPSTVISTAVIAQYYTLKGWTAGQTNNASADVGDSLMIIDQAGYYLVSGSFSFTHATNSTLVHISCFKRDGAGAWVEQTNIECERLIGNGGDFGNTGFTGILKLNANDTIAPRVSSSNTGNLTINHANFNVIRIK